MSGGQQSAVLEACLLAHTSVALQNLNLVACLCQPICGTDTNDPAAHHNYLHARSPQIQVPMLLFDHGTSLVPQTSRPLLSPCYLLVCLAVARPPKDV